MSPARGTFRWSDINVSISARRDLLLLTSAAVCQLSGGEYGTAQAAVRPAGNCASPPPTRATPHPLPPSLFSLHGAALVGRWNDVLPAVC